MVSQDLLNERTIAFMGASSVDSAQEKLPKGTIENHVCVTL